jgi:hypothetical protein
MKFKVAAMQAYYVGKYVTKLRTLLALAVA